MNVVFLYRVWAQIPMASLLMAFVASGTCVGGKRDSLEFFPKSLNSVTKSIIF